MAVLTWPWFESEDPPGGPHARAGESEGESDGDDEEDDGDDGSAPPPQPTGDEDEAVEDVNAAIKHVVIPLESSTTSRGATASRPSRRELPGEVPSEIRLPTSCSEPRVAVPGVLVVQGPDYGNDDLSKVLAEEFPDGAAIGGFPLVIVADDSNFCARSLENLLWVTFTRSNPAADIHGTGAFVDQKHWGCKGSLVIDARIKPHHAPPLVEDPEIERRVDQLGTAGGPLHGLI